jgi:hypothetical protein
MKTVLRSRFPFLAATLAALTQLSTLNSPRRSLSASAVPLAHRMGEGSGVRALEWVWERAGVRCRFPLLLLLFVCLACFAVPTPAAIFTTNLTLTETNFTYDGQDIVVSGATLTVDGRHSRPCS